MQQEDVPPVVITPPFIFGTGFNNTVYGMSQQTDGKVVMCGTFTQYNGVSKSKIIRLNIDGTIDNTFITGVGITGTSLPLVAHVLSTGKIMIGGNISNYNGVSTNILFRLNSDGTLDTSFNTGTGFVGHSAPSNSLSIRKVVKLSNGKILVGGEFNSYRGVTCGNIVRINADGSIDNTFNVGGSGFNSVTHSILDLEVDSNGKILAAGGFTSFNGSIIGGMIRLNADGSLDSTYNTYQFNSGVQSVGYQSTGHILVSGLFNAYNGATAGRFIRLNSNGTSTTTAVSFPTGSFVRGVVVQPDEYC